MAKLPFRRRDCQARFEEFYRQPVSEAGLIVEREAIGANFGVNGYTTVRQADLLIERLGVAAGDRLLDIGSGRGWPGLYIAQRTGCSVVLTDVPGLALAAALKRADDDGLSPRATAVQASGTELPFPARSFDAISHTDAL